MWSRILTYGHIYRNDYIHTFQLQKGLIEHVIISLIAVSSRKNKIATLIRHQEKSGAENQEAENLAISAWIHGIFVLVQ